MPLTVESECLMLLEEEVALGRRKEGQRCLCLVNGNESPSKISAAELGVGGLQMNTVIDAQRTRRRRCAKLCKKLRVAREFQLHQNAPYLEHVCCNLTACSDR